MHVVERFERIASRPAVSRTCVRQVVELCQTVANVGVDRQQRTRLLDVSFDLREKPEKLPAGVRFATRGVLPRRNENDPRSLMVIVLELDAELLAHEPAFCSPMRALHSRPCGRVPGG